jgi:hypothetical protein
MGGTEVAIAGLVLAAGTSAYTISEQDKAKMEQKRRQAAVERATDEAYGAAKVDYAKRRQYLEDIIRDPKTSSIWTEYEEQISGTRETTTQRLKDLYRKQGETGASLTRALQDVESEYQKNTEVGILNARRQAEEALSTLKTPVRGQEWAPEYKPISVGAPNPGAGLTTLGGYLMAMERKEKKKDDTSTITRSGTTDYSGATLADYLRATQGGNQATGELDLYEYMSNWEN